MEVWFLLVSTENPLHKERFRVVKKLWDSKTKKVGELLSSEA